MHFPVASDLKLTIPEDNGNTEDNQHEFGRRLAIIPAYAGAQELTGDHLTSACPPQGQTLHPTAPLFQVTFPALLQGARCYTDAAIVPDQDGPLMREAGTGVFILDPRRKLMIQVKAMTMANSVLMAEAAPLSLAGTITSRLQFQEIYFLTDSQQMAHFYNGKDYSDPPQWDIKPHAQKFLNAVSSMNWKVAKIDRKLNITVHSLATQAFKFVTVTSN